MPRRCVHPHVIRCQLNKDRNRKYANPRDNGWRTNLVGVDGVLAETTSIIYLFFINSLVEESELSTDDIFWSKQEEDQQQQQQMQAMLYPSLPKLTSPPSQQQKVSTPVANAPPMSTPTSLMRSSPSNLGTLRARAHNFISRNILIPETCCVVREKRRMPSIERTTTCFSSASNEFILVN
jgi:hypothetical protein